jgi:hypothetical protein
VSEVPTYSLKQASLNDQVWNTLKTSPLVKTPESYFFFPLAVTDAAEHTPLQSAYEAKVALIVSAGLPMEQID